MSRVLGLPLEREWLVDGKVQRVETFPSAEAIVLLGGSMGSATNVGDYAEMSGGADRVWQTARLFKAGKAPRIIVTGKGGELSTKGLLVDFGVATNVLMFVDDARNTEEEAKEIARQGLKSVLLVTSACHMKRAKLMFTRFAPEIAVVPAPTDFVATYSYSSGIDAWDLMPTSSALNSNEYFMHEWLGYLGYKYLR